MARLIGNIVMRRALRLRGYSSAIRKRPWLMKQQKKMNKRRAQREYFVCRGCLHRIARGHDLLTRVLLLPTYGLFRSVFNVNLGISLHIYPGFGNYFGGLFCRHCPDTFLGTQIFHVAQPGTVEYGLYGEHWVRGNYFVMLFLLWIRRGNLLLDAVTREVVGYL